MNQLTGRRNILNVHRSSSNTGRTSYWPAQCNPYRWYRHISWKGSTSDGLKSPLRWINPLSTYVPSCITNIRSQYKQHHYFNTNNICSSTHHSILYIIPFSTNLVYVSLPWVQTARLWCFCQFPLSDNVSHELLRRWSVWNVWIGQVPAVGCDRYGSKQDLPVISTGNKISHDLKRATTQAVRHDLVIAKVFASVRSCDVMSHDWNIYVHNNHVMSCDHPYNSSHSLKGLQLHLYYVVVHSLAHQSFSCVWTHGNEREPGQMQYVK